MWTTYIQRDTCINVPWFIQTNSWVGWCSFVCMDMCTCVHMYITMCMCKYVHHTSVHWCTCTMRNSCTQHTWEEIHVYMCHNSYTHTHMSGRSCSLVCMDVCRCMQRDTYVHVPWFIQTHTWMAAHVFLSVWMCVCLYIRITMHVCMCVTVCMCIYMCVCICVSVYLCRTPVHWCRLSEWPHI